MGYHAGKPLESVVYCFYKITSVFYEFTGTINHRFLTNKNARTILKYNQVQAMYISHTAIVLWLKVRYTLSTIGYNYAPLNLRIQYSKRVRIVIRKGGRTLVCMTDTQLPEASIVFNSKQSYTAKPQICGKYPFVDPVHSGCFIRVKSKFTNLIELVCYCFISLAKGN